MRELILLIKSKIKWKTKQWSRRSTNDTNQRKPVYSYFEGNQNFWSILKGKFEKDWIKVSMEEVKQKEIGMKFVLDLTNNLKFNIIGK